MENKLTKQNYVLIQAIKEIHDKNIKAKIVALDNLTKKKD